MRQPVGAIALMLTLAVAACGPAPGNTPPGPVSAVAAGEVAQPAESLPPGKRLKFAYLTSIANFHRDLATKPVLRIRSEAALRRFVLPASEGQGEDTVPPVDFASGEVIALYDPLHGCVGWPNGSSADYMRTAWAVDTGEAVAFKVEVVKKPGAAQRQLLCKPMMRAALYYLGQRDKPVQGATEFPAEAPTAQ
jgi:hypothetical protein